MQAKMELWIVTNHYNVHAMKNAIEQNDVILEYPIKVVVLDELNIFYE